VSVFLIALYLCCIVLTEEVRYFNLVVLEDVGEEGEDDYDYDNDDNTAKKGCLAAFLLLIILPLLLVPIGVYIWTFIKIIPLCPTAGIINLFLALLLFLLK
ncbi:MAG: hypothetical protein IJG36_10380, partial [Synergistaceae bacterium]|nr:hypothetical protein [Synergistaceae bacterium]